MPQINSGKSPPWVAGEIVTAAGLNGMIDAATLDPSAITSKTNLATLTGDEYALVVDTSGALKKTQLKNITLTGEDVITDNIFGKSINGTLIIQPQGSTSNLNIYGGSVGGSVGSISGYAKNISLTAESSVDNTGAFTVTAGTGGMSFNAGNAPIDFLSKVDFNTTGAVKLPVGTTAERPAVPVAGDTRFNSTTSSTETYNGSSWSSGYTLYEVYEETLPTWAAVSAGINNAVVTTASFTKPSDEVWVFEVDGSWSLVRGWGASYAFRYSTETPQTGAYLEYHMDYSSGVTSPVVRSIDHTWTVPAGTALSARSLVFDAFAGSGSQLTLFKNTSLNGYTALITTGSLPASKFRIRKYKTT